MHPSEFASSLGVPEADEATPTVDLEATRAWWSQRGYELRFREEAWFECVLAGHGECWHGRGLTRSDALAAALRRAFPSRASRELLTQALAVPEAVPAPPIEATPEAPPQVREPAAAVELVIPPTPGSPRAVAPPDPQLERRRGIALREANERLALLDARSEAGVSELALASPLHQRLLLTEWIAEGRGIEEAAPGEREITRRVQRLAQRLSRLSKIWWPGSVRALQLDALPMDAARELGFSDPEAFVGWAALAEAIPERCDLVLIEEAERGMDEDGWADPPGLAEPPPNDPDETVDQARAELERWEGSQSGKLLEIARRLRWCRAHTESFEIWGEAMGRLRWLVARRGPGTEEVAPTIDPAYRPPMPWPKVLGVDPDKRRKQAERRRLLEQLASGSIATPAALASWLVPAFRVFDGDRLTRLLGDQRDLVLALAEAEIAALADPAARRMVRRRLVGLKEAIAAGSDGAAARRAIAAELGEPVEAGAIEGVAVDPQERLRQAARLHTAGRRAVLVTNRADPTLRDRLREDLGFADLDWNEGEPRRLRALSDSIRRGGFDLVLAATGFQSHSADAMLAAACRTAEVPYVRVNRARPLAVYRAITRDLAPHSGADTASG